MPVLELFHKEYKQFLLQFSYGHPSKQNPTHYQINQDLIVAKNHHKYRL